MSEWISVEDRLPEEGAPVTVRCLLEIDIYGSVFAMRLDGWWQNLEDLDYDGYRSIEDHLITHWAPQAEPPKDLNNPEK